MGWLMNDVLQRKRNETVMDNLLYGNLLIY
jgi:hypothetical protein